MKHQNTGTVDLGTPQEDRGSSGLSHKRLNYSTGKYDENRVTVLDLEGVRRRPFLEDRGCRVRYPVYNVDGELTRQRDRIYHDSDVTK